MGGAVDKTMRVDAKRCVSTVRGERRHGSSFAVYSLQGNPGKDKYITERWMTVVDLLEPGTRCSQSGGEKDVDKKLIDKGFQLIKERPPGILALCTSDGSLVQGEDWWGALCMTALRSKWEVELWPWARGCNPRYEAWSESYPKFRVIYLDVFRRDVCFIELPKHQQVSTGLKTRQLEDDFPSEDDSSR